LTDPSLKQLIFRKHINKNFHVQVEENIKDIVSKGTKKEIDKIIEGLNTFKKILSN
jgi:hypothetical protein